jgi:hypothetical protein
MKPVYGQCGPGPLDQPPSNERRLPEPGELLLCIICAVEKPWGIFDSKTGAAVCIECRDKARS